MNSVEEEIKWEKKIIDLYNKDLEMVNKEINWLLRDIKKGENVENKIKLLRSTMDKKDDIEKSLSDCHFNLAMFLTLKTYGGYDNYVKDTEEFWEDLF